MNELWKYLLNIRVKYKNIILKKYNTACDMISIINTIIDSNYKSSSKKINYTFTALQEWNILHLQSNNPPHQCGHDENKKMKSL